MNLGIWVVVVCVALGSCDESIVQTAYGPIQGTLHDQYRAFLGVPFVSPPIGDLRWANPVPPTPWTSILPTQSFKAGCPQKCDLPPNTCPQDLSEDCLYLNVYTPRAANLTTPQPVMVYLPGGHFDQGTSGCLLYDGSTIVPSSHVILVTLNYRLGFLGWLTNVGQGNFNIAGNFGFMDQIMGLKWVRDNIAAFGGDPNRVTVFGQSAGAASIRAHMISPASKGLFHQAIIQSDPLPIPLRATDDASSTGKLFTDQLNCQDINCLRGKSVDDIVSAQEVVAKKVNWGRIIETFLPLVPTVDGTIIPYHTFDAFEKGLVNQVPLIIGDVSEDALLFIYKAANFSVNDLEYEAVIAFIFGTDAASITEKYPPYPFFGDKRPAIGFLGTHYIFECPARYIDRLLYKNNPSSPVYLYQWDHAIDAKLWGPNYWYCYGHVCHGSELPFEFAGTEVLKMVNWTVAEQQLSQSIIGYYTNFARSGDPNVGPYKVSLNWPQWDPQNLNSIHFEVPQNTIQKGLLSDYCDFWDPLGYRHGWH
eukprot:TRINITY_DN2219_c0_g1_i2.p1 TRINITY_DN2219_c0_g1~~TRINITY_DN2219_c0_g1_i2.p1  ORF type:complete len:533 (+),score=60.77 TRINITY_DN2219_c0_g1_i2:28-1626(+)